MNLTETQGRIMSKAHSLREHHNFDTLPKDTKKMVETMRFKNLEGMSEIDLYVLESYIDKADNEVTSKSVYDLISEMQAFVDNKLLDESQDQERIKLEELKVYLTELNEAVRDWEVREMKREAVEEKPVELDFVKIVDSLSSIVDRLLVQYGSNEPKMEAHLDDGGREGNDEYWDDDESVNEAHLDDGEREDNDEYSDDDEAVNEGSKCDKDLDDEFEEHCGKCDEDEDKVESVVASALEDIRDIVKKTIKKKGSEMEKPEGPLPKPDDEKKPEGEEKPKGDFPPKKDEEKDKDKEE